MVVFPAAVGLLLRLCDKTNVAIDWCIWLGVLFENLDDLVFRIVT
jgi:hypothetical protein